MNLLEKIARIIDPDAWHEKLPTDGCGLYWICRRNRARSQAESIIPYFEKAVQAGLDAGAAKCEEVGLAVSAGAYNAGFKDGADSSADAIRALSAYEIVKDMCGE